jgi:hypothetical protein
VLGHFREPEIDDGLVVFVLSSQPLEKGVLELESKYVLLAEGYGLLVVGEG